MGLQMPYLVAKMALELEIELVQTHLLPPELGISLASSNSSRILDL